MLKELKEYFKNTPKDQIQKDWDEILEYDEVDGPKVDEFMNYHKQIHSLPKKLILVRGLPGSGKSNFAKFLVNNIPNGIHLETNQYFINGKGEYNFDSLYLKDAHKWCLHSTKTALESKIYSIVIVSNTFTQEWEFEKYIKLGEKFGYQVEVIIKENRHNGNSIHNVPKETIKKMKNRFEIKL